MYAIRSYYAPIHPVEDLPGDDDAGDLVVHEFRILVAYKGPDPRDDGDAPPMSLHAVQKAEQGIHVEDRLGAGEFGARVDLPEIAVDRNNFV